MVVVDENGRKWLPAVTNPGAAGSFVSYQQALAGLQQTVDDFRQGRPSVEVLEAGCGSATHVTAGPNARLVGIDISAKQLERNELLDEKIVGDLQSADLGDREFDMIVCWDVLEHLTAPQHALDTLSGALKDGGILVLALPNALALKGLVAKLTPYRAHVFVYRHVFGNPNAGNEDVGPFPTFMRFAIAPRSLLRYARHRGLAVPYFATYESPMQQSVRDKFPPLGLVWRTTEKLLRRATGGRLQPGRTDVILVLQRQTGLSTSYRCFSSPSGAVTD